jgi:NadR type nicotinamide-nucleotide adenylyltransferase
MKEQQLKIVITGAESTGKSTLAQSLARHFKAEFIPELARDYVEKLDRKYTYADVEQIGLEQIEAADKNHNNSSMVIFDTWLLITKVWFDFVYGKHPEWLNDALLKSEIDLFLLCDIDLPWIYDPVRENGGENREKLHQIYIEELEKHNFKYEIINGFDKQRLENAIRMIEKHIDIDSTKHEDNSR